MPRRSRPSSLLPAALLTAGALCSTNAGAQGSPAARVPPPPLQSVEPFFVVKWKLAFMRVGVMMPIDEQLGPPFEKAWGFRLATGMRVE